MNLPTFLQWWRCSNFGNQNFVNNFLYYHIRTETCFCVCTWSCSCFSVSRISGKSEKNIIEHDEKHAPIITRRPSALRNAILPGVIAPTRVFRVQPLKVIKEGPSRSLWSRCVWWVSPKHAFAAHAIRNQENDQYLGANSVLSIFWVTN